MKMDNVGVCAVCGKKRDKLNFTNWARHLKKCNNKKLTTSSRISSYFKVESSLKSIETS